MDKLSNSISQTLEQLANLPPLCVSIFSEIEQDKIFSELQSYGKTKQENIPPDVIKEWIKCFKEMRLDFQEILMRIRVAKNLKRYGNQTEFSQFMDIENYRDKYYTFFKHEQKKYINLICNKCRTTKKAKEDDCMIFDCQCGGRFEIY